MMYQKKKFPFGYICELECRVLELPYDGDELSMIILLPDEIKDDTTGLQQVICTSQSQIAMLYLFYTFIYLLQ